LSSHDIHHHTADYDIRAKCVPRPWGWGNAARDACDCVAARWLLRLARPGGPALKALEAWRNLDLRDGYVIAKGLRGVSASLSFRSCRSARKRANAATLAKGTTSEETPHASLRSSI